MTKGTERLRPEYTDAAIPCYEVRTLRPLFERGWFASCGGLCLCSLSDGDGFAGSSVTLSKCVGSP